MDIKLQTRENTDATSYQTKLVDLTIEWENSVNELIRIRERLIPKRSALLISAKNGAMVNEKMYIPSNKEEREALVTYLLQGENPEACDVVKEANLEEKIKYLTGACSNMRQLISSEQSKMKQRAEEESSYRTGHIE